MMTFAEIRDVLGAEVLCGEERLGERAEDAFCSDFMSDVLAFAKDQGVLLTGLVNPQVVRTADMMDMTCIVFVRGKRPDADTLDLARSRGFVVMTTGELMYTSCGKLYMNGLRGDGCDG